MANRGHRLPLTSIPAGENQSSRRNENDDGWEYYDDSTTLSDFWSKLVSAGHENPLELWLEAFNTAAKGGANGIAAYSEESTPDNVFKEYWRIMVPRMLSPSHRCTSIEQKWDETKINQHLLESLNAFIAGTDDYQDIYQKLMANDSPPVLCGRLFPPGEPTYSCKDCGQDATCVMCDECFQQSKHKNHRYRMSTSDGGGYCDCGDTEAFLQDAMCEKHLNLAENKPPKADILKNFPEGVAERTKMILMQILKYVLEVTSVKKKFAELTVGGKDKETFPDLKFTFDFSRYCAVLLNDENHSFPEVISVLKRCLKCPQKLASDLTEFIDKEGRAVVKVGSYNECAEMREKIQNASRHGGGSLKVDVLPSYVIAHQNFAVRLLHWMLELFKKSSGFRTLFCEVVFSVEDDVMLTLEGRKFCICEAILMLDAEVWKENRKAWFNVVVEGIMKDYESKKILAQLYVTQYGSIMNAFIGDDQEADISITNLSVQMFTVPSIAENLIEEYNAFYVMASFFHEQLEEQKIVGDGKLALEQWMEDDHPEFLRTEQSLVDLQYLMSVPPSGELSKPLHKNLLAGIEKFLEILECIQGADEHLRETIAHIEEESTEWEHLFKLNTPLFVIADSIVDWCKKSKELMNTVINRVVEMCLKQQEFEKRKVTFEFMEETREVELNHFDMLTSPVSIHTPLHQFLASLIVCYNDTKDWKVRADRNTMNLSRRIQTQGSILDIVDPILTSQAMLASTKIGMWKRNGAPVEGQQYIYHSPHLGVYQKKNSLLLMQVASVMDDSSGDEFLMSLLNRFGLLKWSSLQIEEEPVHPDDYETQHLLGDEFLTLLLGIVMERNNPGVANITIEEELEHTLIHYLCVGSMTHSKVLEMLRSEGKQEATVDEILKRIADYASCTREPTKKVYKLKKAYENRYNPFYYYYTQQQRDQAMSNMMNPVKQSPQASASQANQVEVLPLIPPPPMPKLNEMFRNLPRLSSTIVSLQIIQSTLQRFSKSGVRLRDKRMLACAQEQLHKVLFLINVAFQDDLEAPAEFLTRTSFTVKAEAVNLFQLLRNLEYPDELKLLVQYTLSKANEARVAILKKDTNDVEMTSESESQGSNDAEEANARKRRALESRAKILAEMSKRQNKFSHVHERELKEIANEEKKHTTQMNKQTESSESKDSNCVAVGFGKTPPRWCDKLYDCALCKQQQYVSAVDTKSNVFVLLSFSIKSSALSQQNGPADESKSIQPNHLQASLSCGPAVTTCGHVMHSSCYQTFYENLAINDRFTQVSAIRQILSNEFLCPACQRLCNIVIPVLPPVHNLLPTVKYKRESFDSWLKNVITILSEKHIEDPSETESEFFDISRVCFKNDGKSSSKNPFWPQLPQAVASMVSSFAVNNFAKCLSLNPSEEDSRVLQLCFQSAAVSLHLSQAKRKGHDSMDSLIRTYSPFYDECIRSIVKVCFLLPFSSNNKPSDGNAAKFGSRYFQCLRSNALYLLSLLLLNDESKNFLELDAVNVLICLVASFPSLAYPRVNLKPNFGEHDFHLIHLCTVLHLVQVIAGYQGEGDDAMETEEVENSSIWSRSEDLEEDKCVKKLAAQIAQVVGWSDVHLASRTSPGRLVKEKMVHFLRCASLFFHVYTDVPLPTEVTVSGPLDVYRGLMSYLGLPTSLSTLLKVPGTSELIDRLLSSENLESRATPIQYPIKRRDLIDLPEDYTALLKKAADSRCPYNVTGECKTPAMCLVCGTIVCAQSHCCEATIDRQTCGGCTVHARKCCADTGIFLRIRDCKIILLSELKRGSYMSAPYVDAYGETDDGLSRGNPLKLDRNMYDALRQIWANHDVPTKVTSSYDRESIVFGNHWSSF